MAPQSTTTNGPAGARRALVDGAREDLLADAGLALEEHGDVGERRRARGRRRGGASPARRRPPRRSVALALSGRSIGWPPRRARRASSCRRRAPRRREERRRRRGRRRSTCRSCSPRRARGRPTARARCAGARARRRRRRGGGRRPGPCRRRTWAGRRARSSPASGPAVTSRTAACTRSVVSEPTACVAVWSASCETTVAAYHLASEAKHAGLDEAGPRRIARRRGEPDHEPGHGRGGGHAEGDVGERAVAVEGVLRVLTG